MKGTSRHLVAAAALGALLVASGVCWCATPRTSPYGEPNGADAEVLWIFDADFSDLEGDNAGWTTYDMSGTTAQVNHWHRDFIRTSGFPHLGLMTWWCGTSNPCCWRQPRGYGNDWRQCLERDFPLATWSIPGDLVVFEFDQRFAMEHNCDYGHLEISADGGSTWEIIASYTNPGFAETPGFSVDWDHILYGHQVLDLSMYAGTDVRLRFRFESDGAYSCQDQWDNPPKSSCLDGAWQLDNFRWSVNDVEVWYDDAEWRDDNGWVHDDQEASGQTGVFFFRGQYMIDFWTGRLYACSDSPYGTWLYAAADPFMSSMVDGQSSCLLSPPIETRGIRSGLVGEWRMWVDLPAGSHDYFDLWLASSDVAEWVPDPSCFVDEEAGAWYGGPMWGIWSDDWSEFAGKSWLGICWKIWNAAVPEDPGVHMAGIFLDRVRVGLLANLQETTWEYSVWDRFNDWFAEELGEAMMDSAVVQIADWDGISSANLMASSDGGQTWGGFPMTRRRPQWIEWSAPPPGALMTPGVEIWYYFEATDSLGNISTLPALAPDDHFEFSVLPILATVQQPGILLVDKHGHTTPGESRQSWHSSEYYYREILEILGYEWETYDVGVPGGSTDQSHGPDTTGTKYYHTQIWFTNTLDARTLTRPDQANLIHWLSQASEGKERNLLLTGNDISYELMEAGTETLNFHDTWLAASYIGEIIPHYAGDVADTVPGVLDDGGGWTFFDHDDGEAILAGACPDPIENFDIIEEQAGVPGNEIIADYIDHDSQHFPAGVAYTHPTLGYQTVLLGFGMEFMMDGTWEGGGGNYTPEGYFKSGVHDRVNLLANIMEYFGVLPSEPETGVSNGPFRNVLGQAFPNPFNPMTKVRYSVKEAGPVWIEVYNAAGRVVGTLLDTELDAGDSGYVVWDGLNDAGERCASGVYFYRIVAPGFTASRKMVLLK